jgi:lipopolysaccharide/colanic/teichoic acid biosynthesis glycosyltransferase
MTIAETLESRFLARGHRFAADRDSTAERPLVPSRYATSRHLADRLVAGVLLVLTAPLIGLLVLLVRLTSRGPGIFCQTRVGQAGRIFTMYKLRSMRIDAEAGRGPTWSGGVGDPRVTPLGYWLRRLHLDELPQLWNVVRGDMALIGPRPERPEFVQFLADHIPGYLDRLAVPPGITGLAQINLPPDTDLASVQRKLILDCEYIRTASLWLDLRILLCTALRFAWIKGPRVTRLLGLERTALLPPIADSAHSAPPAVSLATLAQRGRMTPKPEPEELAGGNGTARGDDPVRSRAGRSPRPR